MKYIVLFIKGIIVGVVHIVPGVSSGTFMVLLRVYDELITSVSGLLSSLSNRQALKARMAFLVPLALGVAIGTIAIAKVASLVLDRYPVFALLFFIGVIAGGIPSVVKMHHDMKPTPWRIVVLIIGAGIAIAVGFLGKSETLTHSAETASASSAAALTLPRLLQLAAGGFFAGSAMMTPGVSGSYVLLLTGVYEPIVEALDALTTIPIQWAALQPLLPATIGLILGILIFAKVTSYLLKRQPAATFYAILGLIGGSLIGLWPAAFDPAAHALVGLPILIAGFVIAYLLGRSAKEKTAAFQGVAEQMETNSQGMGEASW